MIHRRHLIHAAAGLPLIGLIPHRLFAAPATPACGDEAAPTAAQMAGPFARDEVPERSALREPGMGGLPLTLSGVVQGTDCTVLKGCELTFWQANADGAYDVGGGQLYGRQRSADGTYRLETVVPGRYPGRVPHLHVSIRDAEGRLRLTTQLYVPDVSGNDNDFLFNPALLMAYTETADAASGRFDFVLA
jgi:protocatechuate 3,4-dioxygenase beta subunit